MKRHPAILVVVLLVTLCACKKEEEKLPLVSTEEIVLILRNSITCTGEVINEGSQSVTSAGICWNTEPQPTIEDNFIDKDVGDGTFTCTIENLAEGTLYYIRAYATSATGTSYGNERTATTLPAVVTGTVQDMDGNNYTTVKIGDRWWMAENLRTTHYKNNAGIPNVAGSDVWGFYQKDMLCYYTNDSAIYAGKYGALYNYYAVKNPGKLCPDGWHVSTGADWEELIVHLGGYDSAYLKLIAPATSWFYLTGSETNESGFNALPGGNRDAGAKYSGLRDWAVWWTSDSTGMFEGKCIWLYTHGFSIDTIIMPESGYSVRCVRDE